MASNTNHQDQPLSKRVQSFITDCQARNLSPRTIGIYATQLNALTAWLSGRDVTADTLRAYLVHLQRTHNPGGVHQAFRVIKTFTRWCLAEGVTDQNPMARIKPPRIHNNPLPPVPLPDLAAMLKTCNQTPVGVRDRAILLCLLDTGCRASEFVALDIADLDAATGAVLVRSGKGGKRRTVFLGAKSRRAIGRYLRVRGDNPGALWQTDERTRLTYAGLRQIVRRRAVAAGVPVPALHSFRRAFALLCLRNGIDVYSLQRIMGHADLSVLRRYLAQTEHDLAEAHRKAGPVDRLLGG